MGKPNFSEKQRARRRNAWFSMKRLMSNLAFRKCNRQQQKEYKNDE